MCYLLSIFARKNASHAFFVAHTTIVAYILIFVNSNCANSRGVLYCAWDMVGLAQLVRASDCGPEGRRFKSDIPPQED